MAPLKAIIHPIAASWVRHKRVYHGSAISEGLLRGLCSTADVFEIGGVVVIHAAPVSLVISEPEPGLASERVFAPPASFCAVSAC